jgi:plasmid maintenance system antidote protein VapI
MNVEIFEIVREKLGHSKYKMAKELGVTPSHYAYLSTKARNARTEIIVRLKEISGLSAAEFWKLLKSEYQK